MLHNFCDFATDYQALLRTLKDPLQLRASEKIIQFPFSLPMAEDKTEEELTRISEKRKEQGRKLQEIAAKSRVEKVLCQLFRTLKSHMATFRCNRKKRTCNIY